MSPDDKQSLGQSLDFAEQQLSERLYKNLQRYHDLQKLKRKRHEELTAQDLQFVKESICKDGICLGGASSLGLSTVATVWVICSSLLAL